MKTTKQLTETKSNFCTLFPDKPNSLYSFIRNSKFENLSNDLRVKRILNFNKNFTCNQI